MHNRPQGVNAPNYKPPIQLNPQNLIHHYQNIKLAILVGDQVGTQQPSIQECDLLTVEYVSEPIVIHTTLI